MIIPFDDWMKSEYITIDSDGWHCSEDAPEEIKRKFEDFMTEVKSGVRLIDPEDDD